MTCFNFKKKNYYFEKKFDENDDDFIIMLTLKIKNNLLWKLLYYVLVFSSFIIPIILSHRGTTIPPQQTLSRVQPRDCNLYQPPPFLLIIPGKCRRGPQARFKSFYGPQSNKCHSGIHYVGGASKFHISPKLPLVVSVPRLSYVPDFNNWLVLISPFEP